MDSILGIGRQLLRFSQGRRKTDWASEVAVVDNAQELHSAERKDSSMKRLRVIVLLIGFVVIQRGEPWTPDSAFAQNLTPLAPAGREEEPGRPPLAADRFEILVEEIQATRSSIEGASRLEIKLRVLCPGIEKALGSRCAVFKAVDDTGEDLRDRQGSFPGYQMLAPTLRLKLPRREAIVLKELSGVVELVFPDRDPLATINIANFVGKPRVEVSHPMLTANEVRLTILSKGEFDRIRGRGREASREQAVHRNFCEATETETSRFGDAPRLGNNAIVVLQDDPNHRVLSISFVSPLGDPVRSSYTEAGVFFDHGEPQAYLAYSFEPALPETAIMRIIVATPRTVVAIPFSLKDIPLP